MKKQQLQGGEKSWRLNAFLREAGLGSRRKADELIRAGLIFVNGAVADFGTMVGIADEVFFQGCRVKLKAKKLRVWLYNKPRGVICTFSPRERPNLSDELQLGESFFTVGRLDKDSEGLLLLTNCGETAQLLTHPSYGHEKEYVVTLTRPGPPEMCRRFVSGIELEDGLSRAVRAEWIDVSSFRIVLTQGRNRQIRRMCEFFGCRIKKLQRIRFGELKLDVQTGKCRLLSKKEMETIIDRQCRVDEN
jgi:23S rRNA pseudouridine2604 synthase